MKRLFTTTVVHPNPQEGGETTVLFAGHSQTEPGHRMGPQMLDYYLVHTVVEGTGVFRCRERLYELGAGDSFFIFPGELYMYQADSSHPWRYRWIAFRGTKPLLRLQIAGITPDHPVVRQGDDVPLQAARAIARSFRDGEWTADWEAVAWLELALAAWARTNRPLGLSSADRAGFAAREVNRAARWLQAELAQPVTIADMARELGYHRTHMTKLFRREMGMSPIRYLQQIRMERAKLLLHEALTIEEVARSVGYSDPLYFSKSFKKWTGQTPTEFRKNPGSS